jgi:hypothetical protein
MMKRRSLIVAVLLLVGTPALFGQEAISLTTPITTPSITGYVPASINIQVLPVPRISATIINVATNVSLTLSYPCPPPCAFATDAQVAGLITSLNTANLVTRSLWRRVFDRLVLDFPTAFAGGATVQ